MYQRKIMAVVLFLIVFNSPLFADEQLQVLPETINGIEPNQMVANYLAGQVKDNFSDWKSRFERLIGDWDKDYTNWRKVPGRITEYQKRLRSEFIEAIGGFPQRTPLKARIMGVVYREGYRVEKIILESQPGHFVTAAFFVPESEKYEPPYPAVLVMCGHADKGKEKLDYQNTPALCALNGMAALVFDPIEQGERVELFNEKGERLITCWKSHNLLGVGYILHGRNLARSVIWDGMRCIDYIQSRPEIDPNRIGCMGNSGGGTQTAYMMALDERVTAAAPCSSICNLYQRSIISDGQDAEQNIFGQHAFGMDHADYLIMRAPKTAILVCTETRDFFKIEDAWESFRCAKRLYSLIGHFERINIIENADSHGWRPPLKEASVQWMKRWLLGKDEPIYIPQIEELTPEQIHCTPEGNVTKMEGYRSTFDLHREYEKELAKKRQQLWETTERAELLEKVRQITGIRHLAAIPKPSVESLDIVGRDGYTIEKIIITPEHNIYLPALLFIPEGKVANGSILYISENGKIADAAPDGAIEKLVKSGKTVLAVDLRGTGETQQTGQWYGIPYSGKDSVDFFAAYMLRKSFVQMRAEDILVCAKWLSEKQACVVPVELVSVGNVGIAALHAAALESKLFSSVKIIRSLVSWSNIISMDLTINQLINAVHGALTTYDMDNLAEVIGEKLTIEQPVDAMGRLIKTR